MQHHAKQGGFLESFKGLFGTMKPFGMIKHTHTNKQWKQYWLAACKSY